MEANIESEHSLEALQLLYRISQALNRAHDETEILQILARPFFENGAVRATLSFIELNAHITPESLIPAAVLDRRSDLFSAMEKPISWSDYLLGTQWWAQPDEPFFLTDVATDVRLDAAARSYFQKREIAAEVTLPLRHAGQWVGLVTFGWAVPHAFSALEMEILQALPALSAPVAENLRLIRSLEALVEERVDQLRESESRLVKTADNVPGLIYEFVIRPDGSASMPYVNLWCCEKFGILPAELREDIAPLIAQLHPEDLPGFQASVEQSVKTMEPWLWEGRFTDKDGKLVYMRGNSKPELQPDGSILWSGVLIDVTDHKLVEQQLRESEEQFRALMEQSPIPMQLYDTQGNLLDSNTATEQMWNTQQEQVIGRFNLLTDPQIASTGMLPAVQRAYAGEASDFPEIEFDLSASAAVGGKCWLVGRAYPLKNRSGEVTKVVLTYENITERKAVEAERAQLQQEVIEAQQRALKELSTPIIPIMDQILVMPLVGSIDTLRSKDITRTLLAGISQYRARVVILDITGVPIVDSGVVLHLNKTIQAARLKGARTIVTGISDAVAEAIVDLGIDWSDIETLRDLQSGLVVALERLNIRLTR